MPNVFSFTPDVDIFTLIDDGIAGVNPVNTRGVMGRGLARAFANKYPMMNNAYNDACHNGRCSLGQVFPWRSDEGVWIFNFPTKDHWANPSQLAYIEEGMQSLLMLCNDHHVDRCAIPQLGCGLGGLEWGEVQKTIIAAVTDPHFALDHDTHFYLLGPEH